VLSQVHGSFLSILSLLASMRGDLALLADRYDGLAERCERARRAGRRKGGSGRGRRASSGGGEKGKPSGKGEKGRREREGERERGEMPPPKKRKPAQGK
jgi:hypothetical protein